MGQDQACSGDQAKSSIRCAFSFQHDPGTIICAGAHVTSALELFSMIRALSERGHDQWGRPVCGVRNRNGAHWMSSLTLGHVVLLTLTNVCTQDNACL